MIESDLTVISILSLEKSLISHDTFLIIFELFTRETFLELFWLISERVRHFRPKLAFCKESRKVS